MVCKNSDLIVSASARGFWWRRPASFSAQLVAKSARKAPVDSSVGAGVTSAEKSAGTSKSR